MDVRQNNPGTENQAQVSPSGENAGSEKKRYQKPEIVYLSMLEAVAAVCNFPGKAPYTNCSYPFS